MFQSFLKPLLSLSNKKSGFLNYVHMFRGLAILVIVAIHCRISFGWGDHHLSQQFFITFLDNGTVLFVFVAGFLFQYLKANYEYADYLLRKAKYVLLPYLIVSIPVIVFRKFNQSTEEWLPLSLADAPYVLKSAYMLISGKHLGPFWFIPMITIFYAISPLLIRLDHRRFYTTLFPIVLFAGLFTFQFGYFSNIIYSFLHFFPVYLFGMWAAHYRERLTNIKWTWIMLLVLIYLVIAILEMSGYIPVQKLTSFESSKVLPYFHFNTVKLRVMLLCIILLRVLYHFNSRNFKILGTLGDYSFGIYFTHLYVTTFIEMAVERVGLDFHLNWYLFCLYIAVVTLSSMLIVLIVKKIAGKRSRLIIGS